MSHKILMILTSNIRMGENGKPTGIWAEELSVPYYLFREAGYEVTLASPAGGPVGFDPASMKPQGQNSPETDRMLTDQVAQAAIQDTVRPSTLKADNYAALFFPGGHGTMWDLPGDAEVKRLVEEAYAQDKVIAAVCHGAAGLVSARAPNGESILAGKKVNCFTNREEEETGLISVVPFALESRLRELNAEFVGAENWQPFAVCDGNIITGQNPQSSALVAQEVLSALAA